MSDEVVVSRDDLHKLVVDCMVASGTDDENAHVMAELLVTADYRGHFSHGLNRLDAYCKDLEMGVVRGKGQGPSIIKETIATAYVNGNNNLGPVVGKFAIDLAIKKAKEAGIGLVSVRGSNHFGIAGWYSLRACEQGLLGMAFTNASTAIVPTRAKTKTIGTNPICLAAPGKNGDSFVLDMATSTVSYGKVEVKSRQNEQLPCGWAMDKEGKETLDPGSFYGLYPLGGKEETGGYKGYGLALMVETLCGVLAGSPFGPFIRMWQTYDQPEADMAHCYIALDPNAFEDGFEERLSELMDHCRNLQPSEEGCPVLIPGDLARAHMLKCDRQGGIPYHHNQFKFMNEFAEKMKVDTLKPVQVDGKDK